MSYYLTKREEKVLRIEIPYGDEINNELILHDDCIYCRCPNNNLTKLIVNSSCKELYCYNNELTELILPDECIFCDCSNNKLTKIIVGEKCRDVFANINNLNPYAEALFCRDRILANRIFMMEDCKLKSMLLSMDKETFDLGLEILKNL